MLPNGEDEIVSPYVVNGGEIKETTKNLSSQESDTGRWETIGSGSNFYQGLTSSA